MPGMLLPRIHLFFNRIIELNGGQPPLTYKRFQTLISKMEPLEMPAETITAEVMDKCTTPVSDDHDEKYGVPSLEELGILLYTYWLPGKCLTNGLKIQH